MKKLLTLLIVELMRLGDTAHLIPSNMLTKQKGEKTGYNRLTFSYNSISFGVDDAITGGVRDISAWSGISLDWIKGISVSSSMPLYIETGVGMTYGWYSDNFYSENAERDVEITGNYLGMKVPVNVTYKIDCGDSGIKIAPFAGVYFRGNFICTATSAVDRGEENDFDAFDNADASRFNVGMNFGAGMEYKKLYLGLSYSKDFNKFIDYDEAGSIGVFAATVGLVF